MASRMMTHRLLTRMARRHHSAAANHTCCISAASQNKMSLTNQQWRHFTASKGDNNDGGNGSGNSSPPENQYVHPLSQIVLEHLQTSQSAAAFVAESGLDQSLSIHEDGTFTLQFPNDGGRIFTSFDSEEKKHWLTVHRGELVGRYMLQDNKKPAWHSDRRSVPEKVQDAVDEMIKKLLE